MDDSSEDSDTLFMWLKETIIGKKWVGNNNIAVLFVLDGGKLKKRREKNVWHIIEV